MTQSQKAGAALLWKPPAFSAAVGIQTVKTQCGCHALKMKNRCDFHPVRGKIAAVSYVVLALKELLKKRNQFIIGSFINFSDKTTIAAFTSAQPNGAVGLFERRCRSIVSFPNICPVQSLRFILLPRHAYLLLAAILLLVPLQKIIKHFFPSGSGFCGVFQLVIAA